MTSAPVSGLVEPPIHRDWLAGIPTPRSPMPSEPQVCTAPTKARQAPAPTTSPSAHPHNNPMP